MKALRLLLPLPLLLCSCMAFSVSPLHDRNTSVEKDELIGVWDLLEPDDESVVLRFEQASHRGYRMTLTEENGRWSVLEAHLVSLNDRLFLDMQPAELSPPHTTVTSEIYWESVLRYHLIMEVEVTANRLATRFLNFYKPLSSGRLQVPHLKVGSHYLFNVPTKELQQLVIEYCDDPEVQDDDWAVFRKRKTGAW